MIRICLKGSILIIAGAILRLNCEGSANPGGRCGLPRRTEVTCGNPACKCAKGERHGPMWYLTVTLGPGRMTGGIIPTEQVDEVRSWIANYHKVKDHLEKISEINRELLRRRRDKQRQRKRSRK